MGSEIYCSEEYGFRITRSQAANIMLGVALICNVVWSGNPYAGFNSLLCMALFFWNLYLSRPVLYLKYLHYFFGSVAGILGCAVIEYSRISLVELNDESHFCGSLPLLVFAWWTFIFTLSICDSRISDKLEKRSMEIGSSLSDSFRLDNRTINYVLLVLGIIGCFLTAAVFAIVSKNPSFMIGIDRFDYSLMFDYGALYGYALRLINYLIIPCIVIALINNSKIGWIAIGFYCLHSLWIGNKFGSFFSLLCTITMIYSCKLEAYIWKAKRLVGLLMVLVLFLVGVAVVGASFTKEYGLTDYFSPRLAQQGQLWWKTYDLSNSAHIGEIKDEVQSIRKGHPEIGENVDSRYGVYKIMYYTTPKTKVDTKLQAGSRYTEAGFAAAYYYLGPLGCVLFAILGGVLASVFVNYFLFFLRYRQYVRAFIHLRLYSNLAVFMSMFIFFPFFNKTSLLSYAILLLGKNRLFSYGREQI